MIGSDPRAAAAGHHPVTASKRVFRAQPGETRRSRTIRSSQKGSILASAA